MLTIAYLSLWASCFLYIINSPCSVFRASLPESSASTLGVWDTTGRVEDVQETGSSHWEVSDSQHLLSMFIACWHLSSQTYRSSCLSQTFLFITKKCLFVMLPSLTYLSGWYLELVWFEKFLKQEQTEKVVMRYLTAWRNKNCFQVYSSSIVSSW